MGIMISYAFRNQGKIPVGMLPNELFGPFHPEIDKKLYRGGILFPFKYTVQIYGIKAYHISHGLQGNIFCIMLTDIGFHIICGSGRIILKRIFLIQ